MNMYKKCRTNNRTKKAFTLVELSLAIAFISLLLIIIASITLSLIAVYRKGLTINSVNFVGRSIIEDLQNSVASAKKNQNPSNICESVYPTDDTERNNCITDKAQLFTYHTFTTTLGVNNYPRYGVFCTGSYSYIWNTGYALSSESDYSSISPIQFSYGPSHAHKDNFKLLKIKDFNGDVCKATIDIAHNKYANNAAGDIHIDANLNDDDIVDLIADSDNKLAIYHLYLAKPATNADSRNAFYSGFFILGTLEGGIDILKAGNYCKPPGDDTVFGGEPNFDYCAINKFNFAVQGNGGY